MRARTVFGVVFAAALPLLGPRALIVRTAHAQGEPTTIGEVFMYGVDADTNQLLRYTFGSDQFVSVGAVVGQFGKKLKDLEAMAHIPQGPHRGFYGMTNFKDKKPTKMVKIDPLDASAWLYPAPVGFWKVCGLIAYQDPGTGDWSLIGSTKNTNKADGQAKLISVNPANGKGDEIMPLSVFYTGLALDANGTLYGVDRGPGSLPGQVPPGLESDLYIIDPPPAPWPGLGTETHIAPLPWSKVEALEFAFGEFALPIDLSTVAGVDPADPTWSQNGVLLGFTDAFDMLMIINPVTGVAVPYPGSFVTLDCEGLVFCTVRTDPLYGALRGFD